jgi:hypothetical protein
METLDLSQRNRNATVAIAGLCLAVVCTLLWSQLAYDCAYGICDSPRFAPLPLLLLAGAAAGWLAGAIFGLNALWDKPVARDRLTRPASAGLVMFVCVTLQTAVWAG